LGITLLNFLGGDNTVGPSVGLISGAFGTLSPLRGGLGKEAGFVGAGGEVKYLHSKWKIKHFEMKNNERQKAN